MKRLILLFCMVLVAMAFSAQAQGGTILSLPAQVLDKPEGFMEQIIVRITAPNGQDLHVISNLEQPVIISRDVNFDGVDDLEIMVMSGASNAAFRLFVYLDGRYVPVNDSTEQGLYNPEYDQEAGLVISRVNHGYAGALHETILLQWQRSRLVPVRRAVCEELSQFLLDGQTYTKTTWQNVLHARVYDQSFPGEPVLLFEEQFNMEAMDMDAYDAFYRREQAALWQGLR